MNKNYFLLAALVILMLPAHAQNIAINKDGSLPDPNAILDIKSGNKGLLIPRMDSTARNTIPNTKGLLVFDTTTSSFWYNTGAQWQNMAAAIALPVSSTADSAWLLTGNGNAHSGSFLGTTNNVPLNIRVDNQPSGHIDSTNENTFWGYYSGVADSVGRDNMGVGAFALERTFRGSDNAASGARALISNTSGSNNTSAGFQSLFSNTTGAYNTATGSQALYSNTTDSGLTATGYQALYHDSAGAFNTANGFQALFSNTSASQNTAIGYQSMYLGSTASQNTAIGYESLFSNTIGEANTATGVQCLYSNVNGLLNEGSGYQALYFNTGSANTANGVYAMHANTTASGNTATGYFAMSANTTGLYNVADGFEAMMSNTTGSFNTATGYTAFESNSTGQCNTADGYLALESNGSGGFNTGLGMLSLVRNTIGNSNAATGFDALGNNTTGSLNTATGDSSLLSNLTGNNNTAIGYFADVSTGNLTNATAIGNGAIVDASNKVRIGNSAVTVIEGQVPFTTPSDGRYKFNVREDVAGLDFILHLRPVTYQFDVQRFDAQLNHRTGQDAAAECNVVRTAYDEATRIRRSGFIAQEVEKAADASGYDFSGIIKPKTDQDHYSLSYDAFVIPLVKAVQEQQQMIRDQNEKIAGLERELDELKKLIVSSK
jgi:hypothetical protein